MLVSTLPLSLSFPLTCLPPFLLLYTPSLPFFFSTLPPSLSSSLPSLPPSLSFSLSFPSISLSFSVYVEYQLNSYSHLTQKLKYSGRIQPYIPDFKRGIDHFCIHAGVYEHSIFNYLFSIINIVTLTILYLTI